MSKIRDIPSPKIEAVFQGFRNLTATLTAHVFGINRDIDNRGSALQTARDLLHRLKTT